MNASKSVPRLDTSMRSEAQPSLKFEVCIDTLMNGCVNAFVHLYKLSHRDPVCVDELAQTMFSIPDDKLPWVQEALVAAELKRRKSDFRGVFDENARLAKYFEECGDVAEAQNRLEHALQSCSESLDRNLEGDAHETIGQFFERRGRLLEASIHHETRLKLAEIVGDERAKDRASRHLVRVYLRRGDEAVKAGKPQEAKTLFEKAVATSKACGDTAAEAQAYSALGNVTVLLGDMQKALEYQKRFLVVSRESKSSRGESAAAIKVAKLQESLGQTEDAIQSLKTALSRAEDSNDLKAICDACRQLGEAYKQANQPVKAVHYFRETFRVARDIGDQRLIERARIALGFALGEHYFSSAGGDGKGYIGIVCNDMAAQLQWMGGGIL